MTEDGSPETTPGVVYLVGAGPGDPQLITVRAHAVIQRADAIVYDSATSRRLLPVGAHESGRPELYDLTRRSVGWRVSAEQVGELLIRLARDGKNVVRLFAGDPFVFGRGGEEAQTLNDASISFEIVPGITSDVLAAAYAGVPMTQSGLSESVTVVNGRDFGSGETVTTDWAAIATTGGTLVISRGARKLREIADAFMSAGMSRDMPAIVIHRVTRPEQRIVPGTIATIADAAQAASVASSSTVVIGWTVVLRDETAWFEKRPLFGRSIIVAHGPDQPIALSSRLRELGADVIDLPEDDVVRLDLSAVRDAVGRLAEYQWLVFTTRDSVVIFWEQLFASGRDSRSLALARIAAVGPQAAAALFERGIVVDLFPPGFVAGSLLEKFAELDDFPGQRVLVFGSETAADLHADELRSLGADVTAMHLYRRVPNERALRQVRQRLDRVTPAAIVFPTVASVAPARDAIGETDIAVPAATMSPAVTAAATSAGFELLCEADEPSGGALASAIERALT